MEKLGRYYSTLVSSLQIFITSVNDQGESTFKLEHIITRDETESYYPLPDIRIAIIYIPRGILP